MKKFRNINLLLLLVVALIGCTQRSGEVDKVVITYVSAPLNVPSIIEKNGSYFEEAFKEIDLGFEYSNLTTGPEQTQALASGDVHILNSVGSPSVILSAANGADIKILDMFARSSEAFTLFSHDKNINSPQDLEGKKIGGPTGTVLHELLVSYLASADMSIDDVEFVNMTIPDAMVALSNESIDVAMLAGPAAYNAKSAGFNLVTNGEGYINATLVVAVTQEFYDNNPKAIETFRKVQQNVLSFMNDNYEEMIKIVAKELDLDEVAVKEMYKQYNFSSEITEKDIADMQRTADFMFKHGMIEKEIDVRDLIIR